MFGDQTSTKEEVYAFYKYWETSATIKPFAYVDLYDARQAPNRRIKRLIENDNQKERNKERTKYNQKLHDLVANIKSRDARMLKFTQEDLMAKKQRQAEIESAREEKR